MNPVKALRLERGLTITEFALLLDTDYYTAARLEYGHNKQLPPRVLKGLVAAGIDAEEIQRQYINWRSAWRSTVIGRPVQA